MREKRDKGAGVEQSAERVRGVCERGCPARNVKSLKESERIVARSILRVVVVVVAVPAESLGARHCGPVTYIHTHTALTEWLRPGPDCCSSLS